MVGGRRFRPTHGHLEFVSMSIVIGPATIWRPSELSVEERNLLSSANQSFSVSMDTYERARSHVLLYSEMRNVRAYFYDVTTRIPLFFSCKTVEHRSRKSRDLLQT